MPHPVVTLQSLFRLDTNQVEALKSVLQVSRVPKGTIISTPSGIHSQEYYILRGAARSFQVDKGKERTVAFSFDDEYITTRSHIVNRSLPQLSIMFLEDSDIVYIPRQQMSSMLRNAEVVDSQETLMFMIAALINHVAKEEERLYNLLNRTAEERYHWAMTRYPRLATCATSTQVASFLGITKETIYRIRSGRYNSRH